MAKEKAKPVEREYVVPLREKCRPVPRYKKTPKAIKSLKEFIARHMQVRDRDLKKIRIDGYLNELIWARGIKKPLYKVKVRAIKEGDIVRVYASELSTKLKFKKERMEKQDAEAKATVKATAEKQKSMMEKAKEQIQPGQKKEETLRKVPKDENKDGVDDKKEIKEKKASVEETEKKEEKKEHKEAKHTTKTKETGQPEEQVSEK